MTTKTMNEEMINETLTWDEVNAMIELKKQELKALKALTNPKSGLSQSEKIEKLRLKWESKSPLGSKLIGKKLTFKPFGSNDPLIGVCKTLVEDKRVPTILIKILCQDKIYHKDHKSINLEVFQLNEDDKMIITK